MNATPTPEEKRIMAAEQAAKVEWWRKLIKRKRKAEGTFDGDTGLFTPSAVEAPKRNGAPDLSPRAPKFFTSRAHVWLLVLRATRGEPVPADIAESFRDDYGKLHERAMVGTINARLKRESDAHEKARREKKKAELKALLSTRAARIKHKEQLVAKLERKAKALQSRIKSHRRSIAALKRAEERANVR